VLSVEDRIYEIEQKYAHLIQDVLVLSMTDETFRLLLALLNGTTLRVSERWRGQTLIRYSYYWLDSDNRLKTGWDNLPHHSHISTHPHHKHSGQQSNVQPSQETNLDEVVAVILSEISADTNS